MPGITSTTFLKWTRCILFCWQPFTMSISNAVSVAILYLPSWPLICFSNVVGLAIGRGYLILRQPKLYFRKGKGMVGLKMTSESQDLHMYEDNQRIIIQSLNSKSMMLNQVTMLRRIFGEFTCDPTLLIYLEMVVVLSCQLIPDIRQQWQHRLRRDYLPISCLDLPQVLILRTSVFDTYHAEWPHLLAAYQIEGSPSAVNRTASIWDTFSHPDTASGVKNTADGLSGDVATDSFNRWKEDIALLKSYGANAYRFSLSWSRIINFKIGPDAEGRDPANHEGIKYYREFIEELVRAGITPAIVRSIISQYSHINLKNFRLYTTGTSLKHYKTAMVAGSIGGSLMILFIMQKYVILSTLRFPLIQYLRLPLMHTETLSSTGVFCRMCCSKLAHPIHLCRITLNEPWIVSAMGYGTGRFAPGRSSVKGGGNSATEPWM